MQRNEGLFLHAHGGSRGDPHLLRSLLNRHAGVLASQCLDRRIESRDRLTAEIAIWEQQRNASGARIKWMFTTEKARAEMGRAYPQPANTSAENERVKTSVPSY